MTDKVKDKYSSLSADDIRNLVIDKKWIAEIINRCNAEIQNVTESITGSISILNDRYMTTLPEIESTVNDLRVTVSGYLKSMGIE